MKRPLTVAALVIAAAPLAFGQTAASKQSPPAAASPQQGRVEQTLMQMERDATAALLKRDSAAVPTKKSVPIAAVDVAADHGYASRR